MTTISEALFSSLAYPDQDIVLVFTPNTRQLIPITELSLKDQDSPEVTWNIFKKNITRKIESPELKQAFLDDCNHIEKKSPLKLRHFNMLTPWFKTDEKLKHFISPSPIQAKEWNTNNIPDNVKDQLIFEAQRARTHFYAPYSHFPVGAAILTTCGKIFHGCNVENAAYGSTICAERSAVLQCVSYLNRGTSIELQKQIVAIGLVLRSGGSPCGSCRQMLNEMNPDMKIFMADVDGIRLKDYTLRELLPIGFGPENLR